MALAQGLAAAGQACVLAILGPAPTATQCAAVADIPNCSLLKTGLPLDWTLKSQDELSVLVNALINLANQVNAAAAHVHSPALAAGHWPIPVVAVAHSCMATWWDAVFGQDRPQSIEWHATATADGLLAANEVIAPSKAFSVALQRVYRCPRSIHVIHNGLPQPTLHPFEHRTAVLAAGRLWDKAKNLLVLDEAAAIATIDIAAAGPTCGPDGARVSFPNIREIGELTPDRLQHCMRSAAIFASPALYEPFGLAVLEAAQCETPLVLSDIPTFRELWSDAAIFLPANQPLLWANALSTLANDVLRLRELGQAACQRAARYTQESMVSATMDVHNLLSHRDLRAA